jgi:PAS domain S-box-containing protein
MRRGRDEPGEPRMVAALRASGMRARVHDFDWSATPLGSRDRWPAALALSVDLALASGFAMAVRWGPDQVTIYNDAYIALLGERHPAALGKPLREIWPEIIDGLGPLSAGILNGTSNNFFAVDHPWTLQRHGVPEEAFFTISYSPLPDPQSPNGIGGILVTAVETTERVRNEKMLRVLTDQLESEVQMRTRERDRIWAVSEDLLGVSNFEGYFTSINPAWTNLLGWSEEEIKARHVNELRHPDDTPASNAGRARLAQGVPTVRMENRFRHRDGSWRWIAWTLTADNGLIYVSGRHITMEKEAAERLRGSEQKLRLLMAGVVDYAFIMLDPDGIVTSWNPGAEHIKGYTEREIIGRHFSQFYTEADRFNGLPDRSLSIAAATGKFEAEAWRVRKDGSQFFASVVIDAIRDSKGELIGFAKITRDVTERRNTQEALERARTQLAQAQKMEALGQLTGGVAHDFNNLLMIVTGQAQTLLRRLSDPKNVRALEAIQTAAARGEALTRQLLMFSRRQALNPQTVSPAQTIAAFEDMLASSVRGNVELQIAVSPEIWPLSIDISEFELALVNLVVNARDAMPDGGHVTVSAANVTLTGGETPERLRGEFVAITVADTGGGIAPDILSKIFEPFFTTKSPGKGTGLGLSQVYGFAQQSGGAVAVDSGLGRGTEVTIYLPRSHEPVAAAPNPEPAAPASGQGETILVVEDNPDVKAVATALLEQLRYQTIAVDSAPAALKALASGQRIDLVFTDVMLPGDVDGLMLAQTIRGKYPNIPVLLTSGYAKALTTRHGLPILRKPYQISALDEAIRESLNSGRAAGERPQA